MKQKRTTGIRMAINIILNIAIVGVIFLIVMLLFLTKEMFLSTRSKDSVSEMSNYRVEACDNGENDYFQKYYYEYIRVGEEEIN